MQSYTSDARASPVVRDFSQHVSCGSDASRANRPLSGDFRHCCAKIFHHCWVRLRQSLEVANSVLIQCLVKEIWHTRQVCHYPMVSMSQTAVGGNSFPEHSRRY